MTQETNYVMNVGDTSCVWEVGFITSAQGVLPIVLANLDGNFFCRLEVRDSKGNVTNVAKDITTKTGDNKRFTAWLTPAETTALGEGDWIVGIELRNATLVPPLIKELHKRVCLQKQVVVTP